MSFDRKAYMKRHHAEYMPKFRARNSSAEYDANRRVDIRVWYREYKKGLKCSRCGFDHPAALEFHHRDPEQKTLNVGDMVRSRQTKERILEEIEKCDVLCRNCHAVLHWGDTFE